VLHYKLRQDKKKGAVRYKTVVHVTISPKYEHVILHIKKIYMNCSRSAQFIVNLATYYMT